MSEETPSRLEFQFVRLREEISYEANLIVQRTSWFVGAQAFFFASLAVGLDPTATERTVKVSLLFPLIPYLSIMVCILTILSVSAAVASATVYRDRLEDFVQEHREFEFLWRKPPKLIYHFGLLSTQVLPFVFLAAWIYLLFSPNV
ncbi:MAG: hypothetical protein AAF465_10385 [Pseudomonadota bacterium]